MSYRLELAALALAFAVTAAGCSSGGGAECKLEGGTVLAGTPWPKFRRDAANTGRIDVDVGAGPRVGRQLFPPAGMTIGAVATSPILAVDRIFLASSDGNVYVLDFDGGQIPLEDDITSASAITASPLIGEDGTLFVASGDGTVAQFDEDGTAKNIGSVGGFIAASPNIGADGTIYVGSLAGLFAGVCPNGIPRFVLATASTQSPAAVTNDPDDPNDRVIVFASDSGQVRALDIRGQQRWSFFASAPIVAATLLDESAGRFFVADTAGRVFSGNVSDGQRRRDFRFEADASISASPAIGRDDGETPALYIADEAGFLRSLERDSGAVRWTFEVGAKILSSPAVATGGETDVVVFGADDGLVYAIADEGSEPVLLWTFDTGTPIGGSSPSIDEDGTVYIGTEGDTEGGALFVIEAQ